MPNILGVKYKTNIVINMIPKVIHYCWFGHNPLPEFAQKCIASWRKFLPDYEVKEWNEDNVNELVAECVRMCEMDIRPH